MEALAAAAITFDMGVEQDGLGFGVGMGIFYEVESGPRSTQGNACCTHKGARTLAAAGAGFDLVEYAHAYPQATAILLDAHVEGYGGGGHSFQWSLLAPSVACHLVLSGGLTPANVTDGIVQVRPRCTTLAVDVSSGVELEGPDGKPIKGVKDTEKIHRFVAAVRAADAHLAETPNGHLSTP